MDSVINYPVLIRSVFEEYGQILSQVEEKRVECIYDDANGHYEILWMGWEGSRRIHGCVVHVDLIDGKIWIQYDGTERGVANDFVDAGVPKDRIVLGFQSPAKRPYTDFASE